ncbi:hypothetical protein N8I74_18710 [Chitiniphilus purpureus]|uniref:Flagellar assembly protein T middle domain-containing protein n=1 Tax=Chitiniphilus purpureus TaxID=2981137 RepID=A0ABY6DQE7_9NEIS|nr:flagella assembly protein FlgT middle domain-containing protein [Chitiniphilus sp. CD1]UXY15321.1 hypothetical protein N8I74_18710 [Chitiniphilus sp. CD1]
MTRLPGWARLGMAAVATVALHASAAPVIGVAPLSGGSVAQARQAALEDALANAALAEGAQVYALEQGGEGRLAQGQLREGARPSGYRVLREWQGSGLYQIEIEPRWDAPAAAPVPTPTPAPQPKAASTSAAQPRCTDPYRRKLLVTPFHLRQPGQARDLGPFQLGLQEALAERLAQAGLLAQRGGNEVPFAIELTSDLRLQPEQVRRLARQQGVQFVLGGVVNDVRAYGERYALSFGADDARSGERTAELTVPLFEFARAGLKATPRSRRFDVDLLLFDGISGALVARRRFAGEAGGQVVFGTNEPFGSGAFLASGYGIMVAGQLDAMVHAARDTLACLPFSARVVRVDAGQVYLDAGGLAGLAPGDKLQRYRLRPGSLPLDGLGTGGLVSLGLPEEPAGSLTVVQVQPLFAVAVADQGRPEVGDYARSAVLSGTAPR